MIVVLCILIIAGFYTLDTAYWLFRRQEYFIGATLTGLGIGILMFTYLIGKVLW